MGGTELWTALLSVALLNKARNGSIGIQKGQSTAVILVTDGELSNESWTIRLLLENSKYLRVFPIGIDSHSQRALRSIAHAGGGIAEFHTPSEEQRIASLQLERAYAASRTDTQAEVKLSWDTHTPPLTVAPHKLPPLLHNERYVVYAMLDGPCMSAKLSASTVSSSNQGDISWKTSTHDMAILKGDFIHKMACKAIIKDWEDGLYDCDGVANASAQREKIPELTQLSIKYNILSPWTSFVAVEERTEHPSKRAAFTIDDLLRLQSVDELSGLTWTPLDVHEVVRPATPQVGVDDFDLLSVVGKGSFGKVLQVRKKESGEILAMTVASKGLNEQLNFEAQVDRLLDLRHPFISSLHHAFQTDSKVYYISDAPGGGDLFYHLQKTGTFKEDWVRFYGAELVLALEYLHNHSIECNLEAENIQISRDGHIWLPTTAAMDEPEIDFRTTTFCGAVEYYPPEVLKGHRPKRVGFTSSITGTNCTTGGAFATNWYTLGVLLYEMLTGLPPFYSEDVQFMYQKILAGTSVLKFPPTMDEDTKSLLKQLLETDPNQRLTHPQYIKKHPFFAGIDWNLLLIKAVTPPILPKENSDTCSIDPAFTSEIDGFTCVTEDDSSYNDFEGFTYNPTGEHVEYSCGPMIALPASVIPTTKPSTDIPPTKNYSFSVADRTSSEGESADLSLLVQARPTPQVKSESDIERLRSLVSLYEVFKGMRPEELAIFLKESAELQVVPHEIVIQQGDIDQKFYLVDEGELAVLKNGMEVAKLGRGRFFGELALLNNAPRAATIKASTKCTLWVINRDTFKRTVMTHFQRQRDFYEALIASIPALSWLETYQRALVADVLSVKNYYAGNIILQGAPIHALYIVQTGEVSAVFGDEERILGEKMCFGYKTLLGEQLNSVHAIGVVRILTVDQVNMDRIVELREDKSLSDNKAIGNKTWSSRLFHQLQVVPLASQP